MELVKFKNLFAHSWRQVQTCKSRSDEAAAAAAAATAVGRQGQERMALLEKKMGDIAKEAADAETALDALTKQVLGTGLRLRVILESLDRLCVSRLSSPQYFDCQLQ